ncbi:lipoyl(octanoyl) transferase LipB [Lutimonas zeaxanthinifaciens]|nr:lipoyl(octanoyl) transferase LipB [Lutimonas sp. YSD2104]WKK67615.1 lipoyl(octanoyl) transferase LipB [Lutimonas sp. YSD2104]
MMNQVVFKDLGIKDYKEAWDFQNELFQGIIDIKLANRGRDIEQETPNYFLFTEHPPVYTLGKSGDLSNLLLNQQQLEQKGISFFKSNRGGDITFHGPQQIVGYPILNLESFKPDIRWYMRSLEEVIIRTIAHYGLKGVRSEGETGVWLDVGTPFARKICALGVRTSRWVTMHGFALNVNTNLGYFDHIIPCGIRGKAVTSIEAELNRKIPLEEVKSLILENFEAVFEAELTREVKK